MKRLIFRFSMIIAIALIGIIASPVRNVAVAAGFCQCTTFVANYKGLPATYPNAYQWTGWLPGQGYWQSGSPAVGDILVLQPGKSGAGSLGHVGIILGYSQVSSTSWRVTMRSANWAGGTSAGTVANCTNVTDASITVTTGTGGASFWRR